MFSHLSLFMVYLTGAVFLSGRHTTIAKAPGEKNRTVQHKTITRATVYYFLSPECPLCQGYSLTIRKLYEQYHQQGIEMTGIIPGKDFTAGQVASFQKTYRIPFPLLMDENKKMVKKYQASVTPEVIITNPAGTVVYQGRIDNWSYEVGKKRKIITTHDLQDALENIVTGQPVKVAKTKAIGCFIE